MVSLQEKSTWLKSRLLGRTVLVLVPGRRPMHPQLRLHLGDPTFYGRCAQVLPNSPLQQEDVVERVDVMVDRDQLVASVSPHVAEICGLGRDRKSYAG